MHCCTRHVHVVSKNGLYMDRVCVQMTSEPSDDENYAMRTTRERGWMDHTSAFIHPHVVYMTPSSAEHKRSYFKDIFPYTGVQSGTMMFVLLTFFKIFSFVFCR